MPDELYRQEYYDGVNAAELPKCHHAIIRMIEPQDFLFIANLTQNSRESKSPTTKGNSIAYRYLFQH